MRSPAEIVMYFVLHWPENIDGETVHVHVWETRGGYFYRGYEHGNVQEPIKRISINEFISLYEEWKTA